ncbi:class I SAM-dependent RNA methyltransferase [Nocardioides sp. SYSU DS0663]|uniref:class I SAM-dependent RNA methyltransferase n=1 Tax=Nocardioides sp. SYSU DS0663 TaxID=3416445 RepID=UPI003F4B5939
MSRQPRQRKARGASVVGRRFEAVVGPVAHGGHCIVRVVSDPSVEPVETRVVFTRHGIPGERVVLELTEGTEGDRFWRGDVVEVLEASPDRVVPPCPFAGPGLCGGCDFQHVDLARQRELKADVVREQLQRLAGVEGEALAGFEVEPVAGDLPEQLAGLRWRTRQRYVRLPDGALAMRRHRSRDVVVIDDCRIAHPEAREPAPGVRTERVGDREFAVASDGFWQVHPGAPRVLTDAVLSFLEPRAGESVLDLYAGVGLFAGFLSEVVGPQGRVVAVEGEPAAARHAAHNCPGVDVHTGSVAEVLDAGVHGSWDLVVLDPPREGARRPVVEQVVARTPRAVAYVACDPAALARDVAIFAEHGYRLERLRAFDLFPMTHHVECVALLTR